MDERSFALHQVVASELRRSPEKLNLVVDWIHAGQADHNYSQHSKDALEPWMRIIEQEGLTGVLRVLNDPSEYGREMRHCSPFAVIMPQDERLRILKEYEALGVGAHPAGV